MAEDAYYVHMRNPVDFRKVLLESSREVIHQMQDYQELMELRKRRLETEQTFKKDLKEIMLLVNKLERTLPKKAINKLKEILPGVIKEERKRVKAAKPTKAKKKAKPKKTEKLKEKQFNQVKKLEKALESVEKKLHKI